MKTGRVDPRILREQAKKSPALRKAEHLLSTKTDEYLFDILSEHLTVVLFGELGFGFMVIGVIGIPLTKQWDIPRIFDLPVSLK